MGNVPNQSQRKFLKERISAVQTAAAQQRFRLNGRSQRKEPPAIVRAREMIRKYEKHCERVANAEIKRLKIDSEVVTANCRMAREKLLFSTPAEALAEVVKLEQLYSFPDVD